MSFADLRVNQSKDPKFAERVLCALERDAEDAESHLLYVLRLKDGSVYVGSTKNIERRMREHAAGESSVWVKKHGIDFFTPPVTIKIWNVNPRDAEDQTVIALMKEFGMENVRGGSFSQTHFDRHRRQEIERRMRHKDEKCFRCGGNHFIRFCPKPREKPQETSPYFERRAEGVDLAEDERDTFFSVIAQFQRDD